MSRGIIGGSTSELVIDRSRFIGISFPLTTSNQIQELRQHLKKTYSDASHIPFAYVYDGDYHYDDDGEPSGTGGIPIYNGLRQRDIARGFCAVVRYYGGKKLGVKRLRKAFLDASKQALDHSEIGVIVPMIVIDISGPLDDLGFINRFCAQTHANIVNITYNKTINASLRLAPTDEQHIVSLLRDGWSLESISNITEVMKMPDKE